MSHGRVSKELPRVKWSSPNRRSPPARAAYPKSPGRLNDQRAMVVAALCGGPDADPSLHGRMSPQNLRRVLTCTTLTAGELRDLVDAGPVPPEKRQAFADAIISEWEGQFPPHVKPAPVSKMEEWFARTLRAVRSRQESKLREVLIADRASRGEDRSIERIEVDAVTPRQRARIDRDFPSGNYLVHTTTPHAFAQIVRSGALRCAKSHFGTPNTPPAHRNGISFNFNEVSVLAGLHGHHIALVMSPEAVLRRGGVLTPRRLSAKGELQLVPSLFDVAKEHQTPDLFEYCISEDAAVGTAPEVPLDSCYILCAASDSRALSELMGSHGVYPRALVPLQGAAKPVVATWGNDDGDHTVLDRAVAALLRKPANISWFGDLFQSPPRFETAPMTGARYLADESSKQARYLTLSSGQLRITTPDQPARVSRITPDGRR